MNLKELEYYEQVLNDVAKRVHPRLIVYIDKINEFDNRLSIITTCVGFKNTRKFYSTAFEAEDIYDEINLEIMINEAFQGLIRRNKKDNSQKYEN